EFFMVKIENLNFENSYKHLPDSFYSRIDPTPLPEPYLVSFNENAAHLIDLDCNEVSRDDFANYFVGNLLAPGAEPLSMLYAGHQFGRFVPQLGDGRAILLGEIRSNTGELWDLQLKGAGITPYSRQGDGRAVLRSSIREYLCSEAVHALGIPTSRALCIVGSDEEVYRERIESAAVVTRLSSSHVRFGTFEVFYHRKQYEQISTLTDYVIDRHFPHLAEEPGRYLMFLSEVTERTAKLMAQWQSVGFSHGVMNTDNMSIIGLTIDYGPFGFMETFDPGYICNHSDPDGRYAYDQQPQVGLWNLACLARALSPLISAEQSNTILNAYAPSYHQHYADLMGAKLGLIDATPDDMQLVASLLQMMHAGQIDYTNSFRQLGNFSTVNDVLNNPLRNQFVDSSAFDTWATSYKARLQQQAGSDSARKARMDRINPKYILRNYLAQNAIQRAEQERDFSEVDRLLKLLSHPFDEQPEMNDYAATPPDWAQNIEVSCSS
ncbi:MAG: YdiU family protein, partial [Gallionella sp.]